MNRTILTRLAALKAANFSDPNSNGHVTGTVTIALACARDLVLDLNAEEARVVMAAMDLKADLNLCVSLKVSDGLVDKRIDRLERELAGLRALVKAG